MPSQKNIDQLTVIKDKMGQAKSIVLTNFSGLNASDQTDLRAKISEAGGEMNISKNTLVRIALQEKIDELPDFVSEALNGPTAIMYGYDDAVGMTKVVVDYAKEHEQVAVKMGILTGTDGAADTIMSLDQVKQLASMPSKDELRGQVVGTLYAPVTGFVNVMAGNLRGLVNVLNAIKDKNNN